MMSISKRKRSVSSISIGMCASYTSMKYLWLPRTVLEPDFLVSMPKIKTHHWAGVTLSMKNLFGIVLGAEYGWPKNILHWRGIQESVLDLCATVCDLNHNLAVWQRFGLFATHCPCFRRCSWRL